MDQTHIHLIITHLPIFGSLIGGLVLIHGIWTKSNQTLIAGYNVLILSAIGASIAYITGEGAEETVEHLPGFTKNVIEEHQESAEAAIIAMVILGVFALAGVFFTVNQSPLTRNAAIITAFVTLVCFGIVSWTGYLGGKIRHTEIATTLTPKGTPPKLKHDD
ncbi:hypothetical protein [Mucilaginibacter xinganensis]|uniref:DUF2231 domain-containing protein n=1 Tax=Mucilaginibacter xinganensis TaxID=1234841 RepID=A0A223NRK9_9SPHI|nr:hypothetical protein [Mucilaginibacter xinganensis]ASU32390.1 hypothetical protein MuYL_0487 [Mucilaginibacter xinganensis]